MVFNTLTECAIVASQISLKHTNKDYGRRAWDFMFIIMFIIVQHHFLATDRHPDPFSQKNCKVVWGSVL